MKFYNRKNELKEMELLNKKTPAMIVITGKRRVGKTELIKEFLKKHRGIYLFVDDEKSEKILLREYEKTLKENLSIKKYLKITSWEDLLSLIFDKSKEHHLIISFDEFQRFISINKSFINQLQKYWDIHKQKTRLFLILTGSSIGMIKKIFIEHNAPLFKRATNIINLKPFKFGTIKNILHDLNIKDIKDQIELYALFEGVIYYYTLIDYYSIRNIQEAIKKLLLRDLAPLRNEVRETIIESFGREHKTYYSILTAIALGKNTKKEIADYVDVKETSLSPYLYDLTEILEVVNYEVPITEPKPWKSKKGRHVLNDNFFKFWFKFIFRNLSRYEIGDYEYLKKEVNKELNSFIGKAFEGVCKEFISKKGFKITKIGKWWSRKGDEIDLIALNEETKDIMFIECKWQERINPEHEVKKLKEKAKLVEWHKNKRKEKYVILAKSFKKTTKEKDVLIYDLEDIKKLM